MDKCFHLASQNFKKVIVTHQALFLFCSVNLEKRGKCKMSLLQTQRPLQHF